MPNNVKNFAVQNLNAKISGKDEFLGVISTGPMCVQNILPFRERVHDYKREHRSFG